MNERFLLYLDLLGFSELVRIEPDIVPNLFHALDRSQAHRHTSFEVIQFSDTLLVFNNKDPLSDYDKHYFAMYLCEFAQELQYMLLGRGAFLRGLVTRGQFEDTGSSPNHTYKHIRSFWGNALIHACQVTSSIKAIGLFVDEHVKPHMRVFDMHPYDHGNQIWFVDTTSLPRQSFDYLTNKNELSIAMDHVRSCGMEEILSYDLLFLKRLFESSHDHRLAPTVRTKYLTTWEIYRRKYRILCRVMEDVEFDFKKLPGHDWEQTIAKIERHCGFFG